MSTQTRETTFPLNDFTFHQLKTVYCVLGFFFPSSPRSSWKGCSIKWGEFPSCALGRKLVSTEAERAAPFITISASCICPLTLWITSAPLLWAPKLSKRRPLNQNRPRSFLLRLLSFYFLPFLSSCWVFFSRISPLFIPLMQNTGLAPNPPKGAGGLRRSSQTWTRLPREGGSFWCPLDPMQPLPLYCAVGAGGRRWRLRYRGEAHRSHLASSWEEARVHSCLVIYISALFIWLLILILIVILTPQMLKSQRKMEERAPTWRKRDEACNEHERLTSWPLVCLTLRSGSRFLFCFFLSF